MRPAMRSSALLRKCGPGTSTRHGQTGGSRCCRRAGGASFAARPGMERMSTLDAGFYFVEHDNPTDAMETVKAGIDHLKSLNV